MKTPFLNTCFFLILFFPISGNGQYITITGYITNEKNSSYLENVNLFESGSVIGTLTDRNGFYHLMLPPGTVKLSASLNGFKDFSKQLEVKNDTVFSFRLKPVTDSKSLTKKEIATQTTASKNGVDNSK